MISNIVRLRSKKKSMLVMMVIGANKNDESVFLFVNDEESKYLKIVKYSG